MIFYHSVCHYAWLDVLAGVANPDRFRSVFMAQALNCPRLRLKYGQKRYPNSLRERTGAFSRFILLGSNRKGDHHYCNYCDQLKKRGKIN